MPMLRNVPIWTRRAVLAAAAGLLAGPSVAGARDLEAWLQEVPLDRLDPFGPADRYPQLRPVLFDWRSGRRLVERLWRAYQRGHRLAHGEWTLIYFFIWWRSIPTRTQRLKAIRAGVAMADRVRRDHPKHPVGAVWGATFLAMEAITRGVLDALNLIPSYLERLRQAEVLDRSYFYGIALLLQAKSYLKLPPFPISHGDVAKARRYLELGRPYAEGRWPVWYLTWAEYELVAGRLEPAAVAAAREWIARMQREVRADRLHLAYDLEVGVRDGAALLRAVANGSYDRYRWDPVTVLPE